MDSFSGIGTREYKGKLVQGQRMFHYIEVKGIVSRLNDMHPHHAPISKSISIARQHYD